jgi:membrane-bound inhibitor of C-type lysozyme
MTRLLLVIGLSLLAAACATVQAPDSTAAALPYRCDGSKSFTVAYNTGGKTAVVRAGGTTRTLRLARSGSGARYTAPGLELWGKGVAATLTGFPGGPYNGCATR